jgi:DCN1-like protein 4/5
LFRAYADSDAPNIIGPEGFAKICEDADIPMDGALPLLLSWQAGAKEMAKLTEEEWLKAMNALKCVATMLCSGVVMLMKYAESRRCHSCAQL